MALDACDHRELYRYGGEDDGVYSCTICMEEFVAVPATLADRFTCPLCRRTSYHPKDVEHRYCPECGAPDAPKSRRMLAFVRLLASRGIDPREAWRGAAKRP